MGGTTGLFVGASLLSFIEIMYYFIVRPYGTMYSDADQQDDDDDNTSKFDKSIQLNYR